METVTDAGGKNGKRICTMTSRLWLLLMIMATIAQAQNTTDPAEGLASSSSISLSIYDFLFHSYYSSYASSNST